jgi:hypothetical protein
MDMGVEGTVEGTEGTAAHTAADSAAIMETSTFTSSGEIPGHVRAKKLILINISNTHNNDKLPIDLAISKSCSRFHKVE